MNRTRLIVLGALMAVIAAMFQAIPLLLSEIFVIFTILGALPIYIMSRLYPVTGILSYFVAFFLILIFSSHEALFFLCTNGIVGVTLGICDFYKQKKLIILLISSFSMSITLSIMNYGIGISIFGTSIPGPLLVQLSILFLFSCLYCGLYHRFAVYLYKRLSFTGFTSSRS